MGSTLHYLIKQMDMYIMRQKTDLKDKKPGALVQEYPKIIWVHMIKCPKLHNNAIFSLRGKFNSILEERLHDGDADNHHIMSIDVDLNEFDHQGNLTSYGKSLFWREVHRALKKFDRDQIKLKPRKPGVQQPATANKNLPVGQQQKVQANKMNAGDHPTQHKMHFHY